MPLLLAGSAHRTSPLRSLLPSFLPSGWRPIPFSRQRSETRARWLALSLDALRTTDAPGFAPLGASFQDGGRTAGSARPGLCSRVASERPPDSAAGPPALSPSRSRERAAGKAPSTRCQPRCTHERLRRASCCRYSYGGAGAGAQLLGQQVRRRRDRPEGQRGRPAVRAPLPPMLPGASASAPRRRLQQPLHNRLCGCSFRPLRL